MELAATPVSRARPVTATLRLDRRALGAWTLGCAPVLYLALRGGGYDTIVYSEAGLATWWIVLVGVLCGALRVGRLGRLAWICVALLSGFALWTLLGTSWSESAEQTITQLGRVATYLGFFVLGLCVIRRDNARHLLAGLAVAFGVVSLLAVLSRIFPGSFPHNQVLQFFPGSNSRLNYPLNYADGDGEFLALGLPLLLTQATRARTLIGQAIAAAVVPVGVLGLVMTASRGGILTAVLAVAAFYLLMPNRLPKLATGLVASAGSAILVGALIHRGALHDGRFGAVAVMQRHQLLLLVIVVAVAVAFAQAGIGLLTRSVTALSAPPIGRRLTGQLAVGALVVVVAVAIAAGVPGTLAHQWNEFKETDVVGVSSSNALSRLGTVSGSHRYQYWTTALHAFEAKPLDGIGAGTFQFYWAQHGPIYESILNAHSLYLETLAETGVVGFVLLVGALLTLLIAGVVLSFRALPATRVSLAAATSAFLAFCVCAGFDWVWQLPAVAVAGLLVGAVIAAGRTGQEESPGSEPNAGAKLRRRIPAAVIVAGAVAALLAIAVPFAMTAEIRASQAAAKRGNLDRAYSDAISAQRLEPYAATPRLQQALALEALGDFRAAERTIGQATAREPTSWQLWLIRARIDAEAGEALAAVRDFRQAHRLNPLSPTTAE